VFSLLQTLPHQHPCTHISLYHPSHYLTHTLSHTSLLIYSKLLSLTRRLLLIMPNKSLSLSPLALGLPGSSYPFFFPLPTVFFSSSTPHLPLCFFPLPIKSPISPIDCSSLFLCLTHLPNLLYKPFSTRCPNNNPM
jgi:hypothetical protein